MVPIMVQHRQTSEVKTHEFRLYVGNILRQESLQVSNMANRAELWMGTLDTCLCSYTQEPIGI